MDSIKDIAKSDPAMGRKLINHHKQMLKVEQRSISEFDKLLVGLSPNDRAEYLISLRESFNLSSCKR
jgi:prephenate dehydrogenase